MLSVNGLMRKGLLFALISLAACVLPGLGAPAANVSLAALLGQADAVIVGVVADLAVSGRDVAVTISVTRTIKGSLSKHITALAIWSPLAPPEAIPSSFDPGASGIWFLKQQGTNWVVLPVAVGAVPFSQIYFSVPSGTLAAKYAYAPTVSTQTKLAWEIAAAMSDPRTRPAAMHIIGSGVLDDLGSSVLSPVWAGLVASSDSLVKAFGLAGQVRLGSPAALAAIAGADPARFSSDAQDHLSEAICGYTNPASESVSSLGLLTQSGYISRLQFCALRALRAIHTKETLPYLATFLDSTSEKLQYEAVAGIASFANSFPLPTARNTADMTMLAISPNAPLATAATQANFPTQRTFADQPQTYISFWKNWLSGPSIK
jgi:hypothetical protein